MRLDARVIERAEREITRVTSASVPALTIVKLLHDMAGVEFQGGERSSDMPGFLFDMNRFFQRLLSRFLRENVFSGRVVDEQNIRDVFAYSPDANPKRRSAPKPRPDYALLPQNRLCGFLDAKYRDIWQRDLPPGWLYQLSIYALASPTGVSVMLYPSTAADAVEERIEVRQPLRSSDRKLGMVILRPVPLIKLAELVADRMAGGAAGRRSLAEHLTSLGVQAHESRV